MTSPLKISSRGTLSLFLSMLSYSTGFFKTYLRENIIYFVLILQGVHASARCLWGWGLQAEMKKGFSGDKSRLRRSRSFQTRAHNKPGFLNLVLLQSFPDWV